MSKIKLGYKVLIVDEQGCKAIRKGVVTRIAQVEEFTDFLSSRPHDKQQLTEYTVCAVKNGDHKFFTTKDVFESIDEVKLFLAERQLIQFDILQ